MITPGWFSRPTKKPKARPQRPTKKWRNTEASFRKETFSARDKRRILFRIAKDTSPRDGWSAAKVIAFNVANGINQVTYKQHEAHLRARFGNDAW